MERKPTFVENIAAAVDAIGVQHVGVVWGLAQVDWPDSKVRDSFLSQLTAGNSG